MKQKVFYFVLHVITKNADEYLCVQDETQYVSNQTEQNRK
jgi:hypothetical protein